MPSVLQTLVFFYQYRFSERADISRISCLNLVVPGRINRMKSKRQFGPVVLLLCLLEGCGGSSNDAVPTAGSGSGFDSTVVDPPSPITDGSDSTTETTDTTQPTTTTDTPLQNALTTGDASGVSDTALLIDAALQSIGDGGELLQHAVASIFNLQSDGSARNDGASLDNISWNPTHDAAILQPHFGLNVPVLRTNGVFVSDYEVQDEVLGIIGDQPSRHLVLGSNPMRNYRRDPTSLNGDMHLFLLNSIAWLLQREKSFTDSFNVVISQMDDSYYFPDERAIREWLDEKYPNQVSYNEAGVCDNTELADCLQTQVDLLIVSQVANSGDSPAIITDAVRDGMARRVPVIYLHHDGNITPLGKSLLSLLGVGYQGDNYWRKLSLANFDASDITGVLPAEITAVKKTLNHFKADDYSFDWSLCDGENCSAVEGLQAEFLDAAEYIRSTLQQYDQNKYNLFTAENNRLHKLLVLIGDHFRRTIEYPMDKQTTDDTEFLKAMFADYTVHHYRTRSTVSDTPVLNLGNFSRGDFSHITPVSKTVTMQSKQKFRSAGVYALPGQTFTVQRTDSSEVVTKVFINTQRSGSTHHWAVDGYSRPRFLQSPHIEIAPGESISMTSPYGGPIQLEFDQNDMTVSFHFENIGLHPFWKSRADDVPFAQQLQAGEYDWAELSSPGFEVHSTLEKMQDSMTNPALDENLPPPQAIAEATMRYVHNFPHVLAGFSGPGIDVVEEIHSFAFDHNLVVDNLDLVKHMNADQATCGYGCSGNPYDAYWSFSPVGHGDIHELGHGLEKYRLRFNGWETHTMTNMYSYYTKTQFHLDTGKDPDCQSLPFEKAYSVLSNSLHSADPAGFMKTNYWDSMGWSEGAAMFIQMMMSAEDNSELINGWHLLPRLHLLEREFGRAIKEDTASWLTVRDDIGLSQYSLESARNLDQNDWLLIMTSLATSRDHRDYFDRWGLTYSAAASAQVQSHSYQAMPVSFYVSSATGYCQGEGFDGRKLALDGSGANWPLVE